MTPKSPALALPSPISAQAAEGWALECSVLAYLATLLLLSNLFGQLAFGNLWRKIKYVQQRIYCLFHMLCDLSMLVCRWFGTIWSIWLVKT